MTDNKDLNQRFDKLEARLDSMAMGSPFSTFQNPTSRSDEIDLRELFTVLWQGKWWIFGITFLFAVAGVLYAKSLPNMYKSEGIYAPAQKQGDGGLGGQLGGLASLAGVSLGGGESNDIDQAMALITSWPFLEGVINKHDLKSMIMGVKGWNRESGELIWDEEVYDPEAKKWLREPSKGKTAEPSSYEVYAKFSKMLTASYDKKVGMLNISVEYYSPAVAQQWVGLVVDEINQAFRTRDMAESKKNIDYLERKISETSIAEMQAVFYGMIETQMKTLMLAEVDEQYLVKRVVEPKVAEIKSKPKRILVLAFACITGGMLSMVLVFIRYFFKEK